MKQGGNASVQGWHEASIIPARMRVVRGNVEAGVIGKLRHRPVARHRDDVTEHGVEVRLPRRCRVDQAEPRRLLRSSFPVGGIPKELPDSSAHLEKVRLSKR